MSLANLLLPAAMLMLLAPLLPALRQWQFRGTTPRVRQTPARPGWDSDARNAAEHAHRDFARLMDLTERDGLIRGAHEDGTPFMLLGARDHLSEQVPASARRLHMLLIAARQLDIPGELVCERLVYARARLNVAHNAVLRTALAGRDAVIGPRARIRKWIRAEGRIDVAEGSVLNGCASAGREIVLARRSRFERLIAPAVVFGRCERRTAAGSVQTILMQSPGNAWLPGDGRWIIDGDISVPPGHRVHARLVVSGNLLVGTGSVIHGDVRVMGDLIMHHDAALGGSVMCDGDMRVGECCRIGGPVQIAGELFAGSQSVFGTIEDPSTVVANEMRIQEGCIAHGAVWAQTRGEVLSESGRP